MHKDMPGTEVLMVLNYNLKASLSLQAFVRLIVTVVDSHFNLLSAGRSRCHGYTAAATECADDSQRPTTSTRRCGHSQKGPSGIKTAEISVCYGCRSDVSLEMCVSVN